MCLDVFSLMEWKGTRGHRLKSKGKEWKGTRGHGHESIGKEWKVTRGHGLESKGKDGTKLPFHSSHHLLSYPNTVQRKIELKGYSNKLCTYH